jgi:hypothetical protein
MTNEVELDAGENMIWSGRPIAPWLAVRRAAPPLLVAIVLMTMCAIYWYELNYAAPRSDPKLQSMMVVGQIVFGTLAAALSAFSIAAALWMWQRAYRTTYHLTNRRVVIDTAGPFPRRTSIPLEHLRFIDLRSSFFGPSDLIFAEANHFSINGWGKRGEGFIATPEATHVERLVRGAIEQTFATRTRGPWQ